VRRTLSLFFSILALSLPAAGQALEVVSGNGQIVREQFVTVAPMTVRAIDQQNRPVAGVRISWSVTSGQGTLINPNTSTDTNGIASSYFLGSAVPGGTSIQQSTVTAQSSFGSASFFVTTAIVRLPDGGLGAPPLVELVKPTLEASTITGDAGTTVFGAVIVRVGIQSGPETGRAVANVGVRIYNYDNPNSSPSGACRSSNGIVLTDSTGTATCDLVLNNRTGETQLAVIAGESQVTPSFNLVIRPGVPCTYSLQPSSQSFPSAGGSGLFSITTPATCPWTVQSNANWIVPTGATNGTGASNINYTVLANTGVAREGTLTVGGQAFRVTQDATGSSGALSITSPGTLPNGVTGQAYAFNLQASGGQTPYAWSVGAGLPTGLTLSQTGAISGVPVASGIYTFPVAVIDSGGASFVRAFTITVTNPDQTVTPIITTQAFTNGTVGTAYRQFVTSANGCSSPVVGPRFSVVSGTLPPGLALQQFADRWAIDGTPTQAGAFTFGLAVIDPCGQTSSATFTITITATQSSNSPLSVVPQSLNFTVFAGSTSRPADQTVSVLSLGQTLNYTASTSTSTGVPWLLISSSAAGTTPGTIAVGVNNFRDLPPGAYQGAVTLSAPGASPVVVPVTLFVNASPTLTASPASLSFNTAVTLFPVSLRQSIQVQGPAGTRFAVQVQNNSRQNWLGVTPSTGESPATIEAVVNHVGLGPGVYTANILIGLAGATPTVVPVVLTVGNPPQFVWSTSGLTFSVSAQEPLPLPQTITLATTSIATPITVTSPTSSGGNWLRVTPNSGTTPLSLSVSVDASGLRNGTYNGEIVVRTTDNSIAPTSLRVILLVADTNPVITSVLHGASGFPGPLAPGSWATINGSFLGASTDPTPYKITNGKIDTTLADARFFVDGVPAPIISASARRAVIQMPYNISDRTRVAIVAEYRGARSEPYVVETILVNPALFIFEGTQGRILNQDGTQNRMGNFAAAGSEVTIFATGEGLTDPTVEDGVIIGGDNPPKPRLLPVQCWVEGKEAEIISYGSVPGMPAGMFYVRIKVPSDVQRAIPLPVTVGIGGNYTPDLVTMVVAPTPPGSEEE
jgi:uncharacterized protein (TIGR03437 family)